MTIEHSSHQHFIGQIVRDDLAAGKHGGRVATRFPPEPNGYLHIGHAKSICLNFGIAQAFGGTCNLRFDDTNPSKEDMEYVHAIQEDVRWLGFEWNATLHASDYFETFHLCALKLIKAGLAFVCDLTAEEVRQYRGTLTEPGRNSPFRDRGIEENLDLLGRMRAGEFEDGSRTLRAKIDMASGNINLRDPAIYRIRKVPHQNTGDRWCIYPMYDYAHCISDAVEGITHSLCTLEFEDHRPLYDWFLDRLDLVNDLALTEPLRAMGLNMPVSRPQQIEFARLNLNYTVMSKRKLLALVQEKLVDGWDDPRMPTLSGIRRRGFTPRAIRNFVERVGVAKQVTVIDYGLLENAVREDLDFNAPRRMAVIDPLRLVITNLPDAHRERLTFANHPKNADFGSRTVAFGHELWIERDDFMETPSKGFHRLVLGGEARLRGVGIIRCDEAVKDGHGRIVALRATLDLDSRPGMPGAERKIKGTIHWVCAETALPAVFRLYDRLFLVADPDHDEEGRTYKDCLNPDSKTVRTGYVEASLAQAAALAPFQFERLGYFSADPRESTAGNLVFNRSVGLRDSWGASGRSGGA